MKNGNEPKRCQHSEKALGRLSSTDRLHFFSGPGPSMRLLSVLSRTAGSVYPEATWDDRLARIKYVVRALSAPRATARWFALLASPDLAGCAAAHPRLYSKLQRPYLHRRSTVGDRLAVLQEHYWFLVRQIGPQARQALYTSATGIELAGLPASDPGRYSLRLRYDDQFEKEGELIALIHDATSDTAVFTIAFTITAWSETRRELFIGGLQGRKGANDRDDIVRLTRSLHGLRPKALLLFVVQCLARRWDIGRLRAVGDSEHIYRHFRKRRAIHASYDAFWEESQGLRDPDGNHTLPAQPTVRRIDELPANKRALYRKRYEMLEELGAAILRNLHFAEPVAPRPARPAALVSPPLRQTAPSADPVSR